MTMITTQDFNRIIFENKIEIEPALEGDDIFMKMMDVIVALSKKIDNLENKSMSLSEFINGRFKPIETSKLCLKHGGIGFASDCERCNNE